MPRRSKTPKRAQRGKQSPGERNKEKLRRVEDELQEARKEIAHLKEKKNSLEKKLQAKTVKKRKDSKAAQAAKQATADGSGLIIGDTVVRQIGKTNSSVTVQGFQGIRTEQLRHLIEDKDLGKPDVVLLHVGTHDLKCTPLDYIMGDLHDLVSALKRKLPEAMVVLSGVLRRADVKWERIGAANERFFWVAQCWNALFVDPNSWVKNTDFARDGIYLKKTGGSKLARLFCRICRVIFESQTPCQTSLKEQPGGWGVCNDRDKNGAKMWDNGMVLHGGKVWTDDEEEEKEGGCNDGWQPADDNGDADTRRRRDESDVGVHVDFNGGEREGGFGGNGLSGDGDGGNGADCDGSNDDGRDGGGGNGDGGDSYDAGADGIDVGDGGAGSEGGEEVGTDTVEYDDCSGEDEASINSSIDYIL